MKLESIMNNDWFYKPLPKDLVAQTLPNIADYVIKPAPSVEIVRGELRTNSAGDNYYHWFLPATPYPEAYSTGLGLPDGTVVSGSGMDCEIYQPEIDWSTNSLGGGHFTTVCPSGGGFAGSGWFYRFFPQWSIAFTANGVQAKASDYGANRRTISTNTSSGEICVGFNVPANVSEYSQTSGRIGLWVYQVYT
jgi:hypothetical protein